MLLRPSSPIARGGGTTSSIGGRATGAAAVPCRTHHEDLWFAPDPADLDRAKTLCHPCPLRRRCLAGALLRREPWGVWGGEIFHQGTPIPAKRRPGRPRKAS